MMDWWRASSLFILLSFLFVLIGGTYDDIPSDWIDEVNQGKFFFFFLLSINTKKNKEIFSLPQPNQRQEINGFQLSGMDILLLLFSVILFMLVVFLMGEIHQMPGLIAQKLILLMQQQSQI